MHSRKNVTKNIVLETNGIDPISDRDIELGLKEFVAQIKDKTIHMMRIQGPV